METSPDGDLLVLAAPDGATARIDPPYPPWRVSGDDGVLDQLVGHALAPRVVGVVLVRLGGFAVGVFDGTELVASKVGARPVHGRSAAGGWSQQRFARRREGQAQVALAAAAQAAASVLLPAAGRLDAVVTGGDRRAIRAVLADRDLQPLGPLISTRVLDTGDPKARVLRDSLAACRAIRIALREPGGD